MTPTPPKEPPPPFYGGLFGALAPFFLFLIGVGWLGISGAPDERGLWPILVASLALGLVLARDRSQYSDTLIRGMSEPLVMVMIIAWLLAGVLASLISASGLIESLVWLAHLSGVHGGAYAAVSFLLCCAVSTATGTSLGTLMLCAPLLYPAGGSLGADPAFLIGAILGGATFGDNISPVSDTTIASSMTQNAAMGEVVRSRLRYALPAAGITLVTIWIFGGAAESPAISEPVVSGEPRSLAMLLAPALVIWLLLARKHLMVGLMFGVLAAAFLGLAFDLIQPHELLSIDRENYIAKGLVLEGLERGIGISIFTILIVALTAGLEETGIMSRLVGFAASHTRSARGAELWTFGAVSAAVLLTTHAVVAILTVGPFAKTTGERFGLDPYRRANLLDITVCTYPFLLPYFIPTILAASTTGSGTAYAMPRLSAFTAGIHNVHSWALLLILLMAMITGFGRNNPTVPDSGPH